MKIKINSIKNRILSGFLFTIFISLILYVLSYYYLKKINSIRSLDKELSKIEVLTLNLIKTDNDFFDLESINPTYFTTGHSDFLNKRDSIKKKIRISDQLVKRADSYFNSASELKSIDSTINSYHKRFSELAERVYQRGFKDYGIEGEMRTYAHALESEIQLSSILFLRRHEKDFLLRNEMEYVTLFDSLATKIIINLENENASLRTIELVRKYRDAFDQLVTIQKQIGVNSNDGLRNELNQLSFSLNNQFAALSNKTADQADHIISRVLAIYIMAAIICLVVAIIVSYLIARKLSKPIKKLSALMHRFMSQKKGDFKMLTLNNPTSEIENLSKSFFTLMKQTQKQLKEIKLKSIEMKKKNNELEKLNDELDKFIYSTAHDLRSPLTSILGLINIAEFDRGEAERDYYLKLMKKSVSKMETFIRDVVDYSKNKKLGLDIAEVDIRQLIYDVYEEHQFMTSDSDIQLNVKITNDGIINTDVKRVKIVFNNLISNAIRYRDTRKENHYINVDIEVIDNYYIIVFEDNGQGIPEDHLDKIFKMFYRANEKSNGSGLGLFILKETIDMLGGTVAVKSQVDVGTIFTMKLPNAITKKTIKKRKKQMA